MDLAIDPPSWWIQAKGFFDEICYGRHRITRSVFRTVVECFVVGICCKGCERGKPSPICRRSEGYFNEAMQHDPPQSFVSWENPVKWVAPLAVVPSTEDVF